MNTLLLLSPHVDDVAFSISGLLETYLRPHFYSILINIFNKTTYHSPSFNLPRYHDINEERQREDNAFIQKLGLHRISLDLPDSSILGHTAMSERGCVPLDYRKAELEVILGKTMAQFIHPTIFCPLGLGSHIDHVMVRETCLKIAQENLDHIFFYEDMPYTSNYEPAEIPSVLDKRIDIKLKPVLFNINWHFKEKNIFYYQSQLEELLVPSIKSYSERLGGKLGSCERVWKATNNSLN